MSNITAATASGGASKTDCTATSKRRCSAGSHQRVQRIARMARTAPRSGVPTRNSRMTRTNAATVSRCDRTGALFEDEVIAATHS